MQELCKPSTIRQHWFSFVIHVLVDVLLPAKLIDPLLSTTLQWRHISVKTSEITRNTTVCWKFCSTKIFRFRTGPLAGYVKLRVSDTNMHHVTHVQLAIYVSGKRPTTALCHWHTLHTKAFGPAIGKPSPCHDIILYVELCYRNSK